MAQIIDAIYRNGVLQPISPLDLAESQRVRLVVEPVIENATSDRAAAMKRLREGIESMNFFTRGGLPSREELHDRA